MLPPILLALIYLVTRRCPRFIETRFTGQPVAFHRNGSVCRDRWCTQDRHW
jgi:hypothetical protein